MNTVTVHASKQYDVVISSGLLAQIGGYAKKYCRGGKVAIISDTNVWPIYGNTVVRSLEQTGLEVTAYQFPAGEASKNAQTYLGIVNFLAENHVTRSDLLIALGGGVVGDLTGFAAATYLRGISYIQVPTSLLAMVDSSVGGKTAIDLPAGKNLVGAFCQPVLVLCDVDTLSTLSPDFFIDGSAEVIKYGVLFDAELFAHLEENELSFDREYVITRCVSLKRDVVEADEFDTGLRQQLNLGHTVGHAVEAASNFALSHGRAVATGMAIVARASADAQLCDRELSVRLEAILEKFQLPTKTQHDSGTLIKYMLSDKKRSGGNLNMIIPRVIGRCEIYPLPVVKTEDFMKPGL